MGRYRFTDIIFMVLRSKYVIVGFILIFAINILLYFKNAERFINPIKRYSLKTVYITGIENTISQLIHFSSKKGKITIDFDFMIDGYAQYENLFQTSDKNNGVRVEFHEPYNATWAVQSPEGKWTNGVISKNPLKSNILYNLSIEYFNKIITAKLNGEIASKKTIKHVPKFDDLIFGKGYSDDRFFHGRISNINITIWNNSIDIITIRRITNIVLGLYLLLILLSFCIGENKKIFSKPLILYTIYQHKKAFGLIGIVLFGAFMLIYLLYVQNIKTSFTAVGHAYATNGDRDHVYIPLYQTLKSLKLGDFLILLGDVIENPSNLKGYDQIYSQYENLKIPFYVTPGNHDIKNEDDLILFLKYTNQKKTDYFFDKNNVRFICLDTCGYVGKPKKQWYSPVDDIRILWLKKTIEDAIKQDAIILFTHHLIWFEKFKDDKDYSHFLKSTSMENLLKNNVFWEKIFPLLDNFNKPVLVLGGDVGNWKETAYMIKKFKKITFLTTGIGAGGKESDNVVRISVSKNLLTGNTKFNFERILLKEYSKYENF